MRWTLIGAISALVAVAAGALGAHGLRARLTPELLNAWEVGARYQMFHALALLLIDQLQASGLHVVKAGWCFSIGTVLFSGSLYGLALTQLAFFGPITPIGGTLFMAGWAIIAWQALKRMRKTDGQQ